jgi:hypothetical protein
MTLRSNRAVAGLAAGLAIIFIGVVATAAEAKQTSLDRRILKAFETIDVRTNAHEQDAAKIRLRLDQIAIDINELRERDKSGVRERRILHGQIVNLSAEYLNQAYKLVDSAAIVISANLSDLATLASAVRNSEDPSGGVLKLRARIQQNVAAGKSMRGALVEMRDWARSDPTLASRFRSLRRIAVALDHRISVDKSRLSGHQKDSTGVIRNKRLDALDQAIDRLGDMYVQVIAEKEALVDLRDEVALAIQLGRLEMTQQVAERAIPNLLAPNATASDARSLNDVAKAIATLNSSPIGNAEIPTTQQAKSRGGPGELAINGFSNF